MAIVDVFIWLSMDVFKRISVLICMCLAIRNNITGSKECKCMWKEQRIV